MQYGPMVLVSRIHLSVFKVVSVTNIPFTAVVLGIPAVDGLILELEVPSLSSSFFFQ